MKRHPDADRLLGGMSPSAFLRRHWQKQPLLVRGAIPRFQGVASFLQLAALASRDDVESRLVSRTRGRWSVEHGPIAPPRLRRSGGRDWTLLVNGVNHHAERAEWLLRRFSFIPQARLDDVMVSFATPGGGVGPHVDSYDVFLVQGAGRRVWRYGRPRPYSLVPDAPLRLIEGFVAEDEALLEPGDMLYLPPGWAHDGVALTDCMTCSVGFRAPSGEELASGFLDWLTERGLPSRVYRDKDLTVARNPARIPESMVRHGQSVIARLSWSAADAARHVGRHLTTPKAHVVFRHRPRASGKRFLAALPDRIFRIDPKTQLLYRDRDFFINGEAFTPRRSERAALMALADARSIDGRRLARPGLHDLAYEWYRLGYANLERKAER